MTPVGAHRAATRPHKKAVNLTIDRDLLDRAKDRDLNISSILEFALRQKLSEHERARWLAENRAGIDAYNAQVEKHGVFGDGLRAF